MSYKLGSLFDGSGGFPLAGSLCGIEPRWASEVEPYPIAVTRERFPNMKHLGDISKINGAQIEPVDIITFGSPCQDLSVAGKRAGLKHEANGDEETTRSGLFMEAVRIIKEMRKATNGKYPRFALWENVPGAFSSNKGEDFRVVCEELIKIAEPSAVMPAVPKNGWPYADSYVGDGWSLAYRTFDAQYWGVPQRRRRIHLVVDLAGECARNVLFEREGLRGYFETGRTPWQAAPSDAEGSTGATNCEGESERGTLIRQQSASGGNVSACLYAAYGTKWNGNAGAYSGENFVLEERAKPYLLKIRSGCEGGGKGALIQTDMSATISTLNDQYLFQPMSLMEENWAESEVKNAIRAGESKSSHVIVNAHILDDQGGQQINVRTDGKAPTLRAEMHGNIPCVLEAVGFKAGNGAKAAGIGYQEEVSPTLAAVPSGTNQVPSVCIKEKYLFENHSQDSRYKGPLDVSHMLPAQMGTGGNNTPFVVEKSSEVVTYSMQNYDEYEENEVASTIRRRDFKSATDLVCEVAGVDCRNFTENPELYPNLQAKANGGQSLNYSGAVRIQYIVRRLTPTECARLQGFADWWAYIEPKDDLTDAEYEFWLEVRNTHAAINGKAVKDYTKAQMLTWYNKLHTDSAEYKMWGNGIALPPALYCMQGIVDAMATDAPQTADTQAEEPTSDIQDTTGTGVADFSDDPKEKEIEEEKEEETVENTANEEQVAVSEAPQAGFDAAAQLRQLAAERKALATLRPENDRFSNDVRAIEYAVSVLEAVGL